jgi:hypothetical protein
MQYCPEKSRRFQAFRENGFSRNQKMSESYSFLPHWLFSGKINTEGAMEKNAG